MKILNKLTIKNLKLNKKRTIVTIIGILLSTALMVGIGLLFSSMQDYMVREIISYSGSYHTKYTDITREDYEIISNTKKVTTFYERTIGFSQIKSENEYKPYIYISSVSKGFFDELELIEGRFPQNSNEVVISNHLKTNGGITYHVGDTITLDYGDRYLEGEKITSNLQYYEEEEFKVTSSHSYRVVGIVSRSNYEDYSAAGYSIFTLDENKDGLVIAYVTFQNKKNIINKSESLAEKINYPRVRINYNSSLLAAYGESSYGNINWTITTMMIIMLSLVSIGCIIVIYNSFAISVMERKKEFALLSSVGASRKQLSYMIFYEALVVGIIGIVLGIASSYLGIGVVIEVLNHLLKGALEYKLYLVTIPIYVIIPVIFMFIVIILSAIIPSKRASRVSIIEAIRQNDDIKLNKKKIKTSKLINKMFGIEGEIALKNIKRNKKKYRITTISLFISIVLFISFSAYMKYALYTTTNVITSYNYDIMLDVYKGDNDVEEKVNEIINSEDTKSYTKYYSYSLPIKRTVTYHEDYINYNKNRYMNSSTSFPNLKYDYITIIVLDDKSYASYQKEIGLTEEKVILLNNFKGISYGEGKRVNYDIKVLANQNITLTLCNFPDDEEPENIDNYCSKKLNNIYVTNKPYLNAEEISHIDNYKLIMNKRIFDAIIGEELSNYRVNIISDNYTNIDKIGKELNKSPYVYYSNIAENTRMENNLIIAVKVLMYGFISLVTLIGVTSVFNTISTSMALRRREFAILRSIGLTRQGFNKILFFESLFFGLKSLLYALPVSFIIIILIHLSTSDIVSMSGLLLPWPSIIIAVISVFTIVLMTMMYSASKIKKYNIIDEIREENI